MLDERPVPHRRPFLALALRRGLCVAIVVGALLGQVPRASAQPDETAQAKAHYLKGKEHLKANQLQDAIKEFKRAYLIKRIPAILFNIAQVYRKLGEGSMALHFFEKFVADAPASDPNRKEAKAIIEELRAAGTTPSEKPQPAADPTPPPPTPPTPRVVRGRDPGEEPAPPPKKKRRAKRVDAFTHEAVDEVPPDLPMDVQCLVPDIEGVRVTLFYRVAGQENFTPVIMKERLGEMVGRIPAREMSGKSIQYYIEARDSKGKMMGQSGTAANPNIVLISVAARPHYYSEMDENRQGADFIVGPKKLKVVPREGTLRNYRVWKWVAAGGAAGLVGLSVGSYVYAGKQASALQDASARRNGTQPGRVFDKKLQDIESSGKMNMMLGTLSLVGAVVVGAGSAALFYFDESGQKEAPGATAAATPRPRAMMIAPIITPEGVAITGAFRF
ncbi:MAG TPA: tetratricopeptide repeat protein [Polyangia bacterium]|jgi:hypothetical protein